MSSFRFFQPPKGSPPSVFTSSVKSLAGIPSVPSAPSGPEVSIPLDPKKQRTKERRKLFDLVMGKAKEGDLSFGEYRDLQDREGGKVGLSPEQFDKAFVDAGLSIDEVSGFEAMLTEGKDEYDVPMRLKKPEEQARRDALGGAKRAPTGLRRQDFATQGGFDAAVARQSGGGADTPTAGSDDRGEPTKGDRGKTTKGTRGGSVQGAVGGVGGGSVQGAVGGVGASKLPSTHPLAPYRGLGRNPNSRLNKAPKNKNEEEA